MKKRFTFTTGEHIEADLEDLQRLLQENQQYYDNYEEILSSLEDDDYVARGNGFCTANTATTSSRDSWKNTNNE